MILYFNEKTLQLNVQVGALEKYEPKKEVKDIVLAAEKLKEKRDNFLNKEFNPEMKKLLDAIDVINRTENPQIEKLRNHNKKE